MCFHVSDSLFVVYYESIKRKLNSRERHASHEALFVFFWKLKFIFE